MKKTFEGLLPGEIKKIERFAQERDHTDSRITGYGYKTIPSECGFVRVRCEICSHDMSQRETDVIFYAFLPDRRRSFISKASRIRERRI